MLTDPSTPSPFLPSSRLAKPVRIKRKFSKWGR
ncbi:unnamed protein product [Tetraodon nigroviridis]|uniref:(spotted green pufferfish) hypothetical protein n=1 Tax=Tetraodon nigroviridis TaxID=99883 RepID=Q4T264_TETNG|nr:unnamed protein product [Tetraodon nigroviridis]